MNLDDLSFIKQNDPENMLIQIDGLPDQLAAAWKLGHEHALPNWTSFQRVVISGMGGSAIGADLLATYVQPLCGVPVFVHRDYDLPAFAKGPQTLFIASSHSGNTEETLSGFKLAVENGCRILAVSTGGVLADEATKVGAPVWKFVHAGQPRAAVGFSFGLLLAAFSRLGLVAEQSPAVEKAVEAMKQQQGSLSAASPVAQNPAKRLAGQLMGRLIVVLGAGVLAPVARRWKGQMNELAKAIAVFEYIPEADHNTLQGLDYPEQILSRSMALFLRAPSDHPRNRARLDLTRQAFMVEGVNTDYVDARGQTPLENLWTALHFGDYVSYYLALANGTDPTPIPNLASFKASLKAIQ